MKMNLPLRRTNLNRGTPFFFDCRQCLSCCHNKKIQVNPYEIMRLAANREVSTADFIARYTHDGGTVLNWEDDGACVFLNSEGCSVHADRPLVCRLYPLGRHVLPSGEERFSEIELEKECRAIDSGAGIIEDYLNTQKAHAFMKAADNYLSLFWRLYAILEKEAEEPVKQEAIVKVFQQVGCNDYNVDLGLADVDSILSVFCKKLDLPLPVNLEERMSLHIRAVEAWANL